MLRSLPAGRRVQVRAAVVPHAVRPSPGLREIHVAARDLYPGGGRPVDGVRASIGMGRARDGVEGPGSHVQPVHVEFRAVFRAGRKVHVWTNVGCSRSLDSVDFCDDLCYVRGRGIRVHVRYDTL